VWQQLQNYIATQCFCHALHCYAMQQLHHCCHLPNPLMLLAGALIGSVSSHTIAQFIATAAATLPPLNLFH